MDSYITTNTPYFIFFTYLSTNTNMFGGLFHFTTINQSYMNADK